MRTTSPAPKMTLLAVVLLALCFTDAPAEAPTDAPDSGAAVSPSKNQASIWDRVAPLIDKIFLKGKVAKVTKTVSDPETYKQYTELAYSMNPVDFIYYSTQDFKDELKYAMLLTVVDKAALIAGPVVGFEFKISVEALDHFVRMEKDKDPWKLTPDLRTKFVDATKELLHLEGKAGKVFDFLFVEKTANDAIGDIRKLAGAFRETAADLDGLAKELREQETAKKQALEKQVESSREEIKRLQGLSTPDVTAERKQELQAQVTGIETAVAALGLQIDLSASRIASATRLEKQAAEQRTTAARFDRIADGVKDNLPLLKKLATYLQKNKDGLPIADVEDMIDVCQEVGKKADDWKGELEDLYEVYQTKGFGELLNAATVRAIAIGEKKYPELAQKLDSLSRLQSVLDPIKSRFDTLGGLVDIGQHVQVTYAQVMFWGEIESMKSAAPAAGGIAPPSGSSAGTGITIDGIGLTQFRDALRQAMELTDKLVKADKRLARFKPYLESAQQLGLPGGDKVLGSGAAGDIKGEIQALETLRADIAKKIEDNADVKKAKKWIDEKKKKVKALKEKWKPVLDVLNDGIKLLDKDMPELDMAPDQEVKDVALGYFGGKGTTFTGFVSATDKTSGINPEEIHLFWFDDQTKVNHEITDVKVIPKTMTEFPLRPPHILEARIRYRFQPPATGDYIVWGYVRDRAGHATCALANSRCSQETEFKNWKYQPEQPEDRKILEFIRQMMDFVGCNPDEVFRRRDFNELRLKLKVDETPAQVIIHEPYNTTEKGLEIGQPLRFDFDVEDKESWFKPEDVTVWIADEFGQSVWGSQDQKKWKITPDVKPDEKFRADKTGFIPRAHFEIEGVKAPGEGIYYACVQVTNGAQVTDGKRQMFFLGNLKPWTFISDVRPFKSAYQQGDKLEITHTFYNISDTPIKSVKLHLDKVPAPLAKDVVEDTGGDGPIPTGAMQKIGNVHSFKVTGPPGANPKVALVYQCTLLYDGGQPDRNVAIEVPVNLYDEDGEKVKFLKGALQYRYQAESRPVVRGTSISVSQVYKMPALGTPKWVEQYIGYGEIGNDAGEFFIHIVPVGAPPYRMRLVAKSSARQKDKRKGTYFGIAGVFGLETSRPLECITPTFDVSVFAENAFKNNAFDVGTQFIPYYSNYMRDKSRRIPIPWEGELSTGGLISPYGQDFAANPYLASGDFLTTRTASDTDEQRRRAVVGKQVGSSTSRPSDITVGAAVSGQEAPVDGVIPGVNAMESGVWHLNFNGSLSILDTLVKSYHFSTRLAYLAKDGSAYDHAFIPLAFDRGSVISGRPSTGPTTNPATKADDSRPTTQPDGSGIVAANNPNGASGAFPVRGDLIREDQVKETFFEQHDYIYSSDRPPPVQEYIERTKETEETHYETKDVRYKVFIVADTKANRVVELDPSSNTVYSAVTSIVEPVSAEKLDEVDYLVCVRGENKVAIYRSGVPVWSFPKPEAEKPEPQTILKRPEFAASTPGGTILICDGGNHRVIEVDTTERRILWSYDKLIQPVMAELTAEGNYLITDRGAHQVLEVDSTGTVVWSYGTRGTPGAGKLLNQPCSAMRIGKSLTAIADVGNRRIIQVGQDGGTVRNIGPIQELQTDEHGKAITVSIALDKLAFVANYTGVNYLINGDFIYSVDAKDQVTGKWGGENRLTGPQHFAVDSRKVTIKVAKKVIKEEPYYVWKETVKVIKRPTTRIYVEDTPTGIKLDPKYREEVPGIGATANYAPGHLLAREHGLLTTGLAPNQERLRIYVNGGNDNADDNDPHVIARAYGSLLRNQLIRKSLTAHDYDDRNRRRPAEAWEKGWDTFIACAITEKPRFVDRNFLGQELPAHTFDLEKTYQDMLDRYKTAPETLDADFHAFRGIDSAYAHAMLFYQLYRTHGIVVVNHAITFARGGGGAAVGRYIDPTTLLTLFPDARETLEVLGLIPKLVLAAPGQGVQTITSPYPKLQWDANSLLDSADDATFTLVISEDRPDNVVRTIPGIHDQTMDFGKILKVDETAAKLAEQFEGRKVYYWRVEISIDAGPFQYKCSSPWGAFEIEVMTQVIHETGGTVNLEAAASPLRQYGKLVVPEGALAGDMTVSAHYIAMATDQGDFNAVHGKAFDLRAEGVTFKKPATLEFSFNEKDLAGRDPRGLGIYRYDPAANQWDYTGGTVGDGVVSTQIDHNSVYALLYDKRGPEFQNPTDSPDPAYRRDTLTIRFNLRKPTVTTLTITDASSKEIRKLCENRLLSGVNQEFQLPLADLPEGRYFYTLTGTDQSGRAATAVRRTFLVSDATRGMVRGRVTVSPTARDGSLHIFIPDTSIELQGADSDGAFLLTGIAPGKYELHFDRPGLFPEIAVVDVRSGEATDVGEVNLSDRALSEAQVAHEVFRPNLDGDREFAVLQLQSPRSCTVKVRALNAAGKAVATLAEKRELAKGINTILWRGNDDRGRPLPGGWYTLEVTADALGVWIPAASVPVLLDRGLVRECLPLPRIFSPKVEEVEDQLQIAYLLDAEALVSVEIRDGQDRIITQPAKDVHQSPGANAIKWDGKLADGKVVPNGRYYFRVQPKYVTGQASQEVRGEFLADSTAQDIVELTPVNGQTLTDTRPVIIARIRPDASVEPDGVRFKIDENTIAPDSFDPQTGVFTFRPRTSMGEGIHIAIAYARSIAGTEAPPRAVSFTIDRAVKEKKYFDREAPTITLQAPAADATVYTGTPLISAVLFDEGSGIDDRNIVVYLDGERICNNAKMFLPGTSGKSWDWYSYEKAIILYDPLLGQMRFVPGSPLAPGKHHVRLEVLDRQGNPAKAAEGVFTVVIDNEAPKITELAPAADSIVAGSLNRIQAKVIKNGRSGLDPRTFRLLVDGREMPGDLSTAYDPKAERFTYQLPRELPAGSQHLIVLTVRDKAGNASEARANLVTLIEDLTPPRIDVYAPRSGQTISARTAVLTAAVYDLGLAGLDESSLRVTIDGQAVSRLPDKSPPAAAGYLLRDGILEYSLSHLSEGPHRVTLSARDRAGNAAPEVVVPFTLSGREDAR